MGFRCSKKTNWCGGSYEREEEEEEEGVGPWVQVLVELIKSRVLLLVVVNNGIDEVKEAHKATKRETGCGIHTQ